jgi:hypothetical protein
MGKVCHRNHIASNLKTPVSDRLSQRRNGLISQPRMPSNRRVNDRTATTGKRIVLAYESLSGMKPILSTIWRISPKVGSLTGMTRDCRSVSLTGMRGMLMRNSGWVPG